MEISEFQKLIERIYYEKDSARGLEGTFMWFAEEFGELTRALRRDTREELAGEFADVFAWLSSLASIAGMTKHKGTTRGGYALSAGQGSE